MGQGFIMVMTDRDLMEAFSPPIAMVTKVIIDKNTVEA